MSPPLEALVVGCGAVGSGYDEFRRGGPPLSHAGAYAAHQRTRLVGGVDPDPVARRRFEERWGVDTYSDTTAAFAVLRPQLVSVCTPAGERLSVIEAALADGVRAIWVEKPLAANAAEGAKLIALCEQANVALQVNFLRRFDPLHLRAATLVERPFHGDFRFSGSLANYGGHAFDLFRWFGGEPAWAQAVAVPGREPLILLESVGGATATFCQVRCGGVDIFECDFHGRHGRLSLSGLGEWLVQYRPLPSTLFTDVIALGPPTLDRESGLSAAMVGGVESLIAHVEREEPLLCEGRDGLAALQIEEAALEALRRRVRTPVPPP